MARQNTGRRVLLLTALSGLCLPLLMGPGCLGPITIPLTVTTGNDQTVNIGSSVQLAALAVGGVPPYTFAWTPVEGLDDPSSPLPEFTPASTGTTTFTVTVTDDDGTQASDSVVVTVNAAEPADSDHGLGGNDAAAAAVPLTVDAGVDRVVTLGSSITLQGLVAGGVEPYQSISWTPTAGLTGANTLTPTFTATAVGNFPFTLKVIDAEDTVALDSMVVTVSEKTTVTALSWGANFDDGGYQVLVEYSKAVDKASAERLTSYEVSGEGTLPVSAELGADAKTVTLVFAGVKFTSKTEFDLAVGDGVLDVNGGKVPAVKGLSPLSNAADTKAPTVATSRWAANHNDGYSLELVFSEAMDQATVESARAYQIADNGQSVVAFDAVLGDDARTVSLIFHGLALSTGAKLEVGLLTLRDINGKTLTRVGNVAISSNSLDLDPPTIVADSICFVSNFAEGGYQVELEYSEAMDRISASTQAAYSIGGTQASSAVLDEEGRKLTLTWTGSTISAGSKLSIGASKVKDINGRFVAGQSNLAILPASGTGSAPSTPVLTWLKGNESTSYQFRARFNQAMDEATVENTANWAITGTNIHPTSVVLSSQTADENIAGRTAVVTFNNFGWSEVRMSRTSQVDVSVGDSIANVNGDVMPKATCLINANAGDTTAPVLAAPKTGLAAKPMWGDVLATGGYSGNKYRVSVVFNETMDAASATELGNYYLAGMIPDSIAMDHTGRKLVLTFSNTTGPVAAADKLQILRNVRDINGHGFNLAGGVAISANPDDQTAPAVVSLFWGTHRGPYMATVIFDEAMDAESATDVSAYRLANLMPTEAAILPDGKTVNLTFGTGLFVPTDDLDIAGTVLDLNGNAYDHSRDAVLPGAPISLPLDDTMPPDLANAVWAVDSLDYRVLVTFDEAVSADTANNPAHYRVIDPQSFFALPVTPTSAQLLPGGTTVELSFGIFGPMDEPFGKENELIIATATDDDNNVTGVTDMHGNVAERTQATINTNPLDLAGLPFPPEDFPPLPPVAVWSPDFVDPFFGGYQLRVTFANEVLDETSAEQVGNYRIADTDPPVIPRLATLASVDDIPNGVFAGRTVWLEFGYALSAASMLDVSVGGSVVDMNNNGIPEGTDVPILADPTDAFAPAVLFAEAGMQPGEFVITFSEAMDWDTATAASSYSLDTTDSFGVAVTAEPTRAWLDADGMTVYVQFTYAFGTLTVDGPTDINGQAVAAYTATFTAGP